MKKVFALFLGIALPFLFAVSFSACKKEKPVENPEPEGDGLIKNAVTDYEGNTYDAVKLGKQVWMASNLKTKHFANGTSIPLGNMMNDVSGKEPYRYNPNDNSSTVNTHGYLYNWPAAMKKGNSTTANPSGVQGACPNGWHMPSDAEWKELTDYLSTQSGYQSGAPANIAKALAAKSGWDSCPVANTIGNNQSSNNATGFNAVPSGECHQTPNNYGGAASFWTATNRPTETGESEIALCRIMRYYEAVVTESEQFKECGMSVRCIRDK